MNSHLTTFGFRGVDAVPYGVHVCHFYPSRQELLDALIPYFQAGLRNDESCIWVAADPLPAQDICSVIAKYEDLEAGLASRQLEIMDAADWYGQTLDPNRTVARWLAREEQALARGHKGLRITGNTSFVGRCEWDRLVEYENMLHRAVQGRRIVACCSYRHATCEPVYMLDVVRAHNAMLDLSENSWQVLTKQALTTTTP
jgi:hypothetical protein